MVNISDAVQVSAVIVNYNSGAYAVECIKTLLAQEITSIEIIVVDNASQDNSLADIRSAFDKKIKLIESAENLGFGRANNLAADIAKGEFLLLINPDARLEQDNALVSLISFLQGNPDVGLAGPKIHEPSKNKVVLPRKHYPSQRRLKYTTGLDQLPGVYAWVLGACMMIKTDLFHKIGGFDPDFFLYGEDADICLRVRSAGYQIGYCENVKVSHVGGASEKASSCLDKYLRKKRGLFLFYKKHYDRRDVVRIAKKLLITSYWSSLNLEIQRFFCRNNISTLNFRKQRLLASEIVAREVIGATSPRN